MADTFRGEPDADANCIDMRRFSGDVCRSMMPSRAARRRAEEAEAALHDVDLSPTAAEAAEEDDVCRGVTAAVATENAVAAAIGVRLDGTYDDRDPQHQAYPPQPVEREMGGEQ